jgi:hypothetical protein
VTEPYEVLTTVSTRLECSSAMPTTAEVEGFLRAAHA